MTDTPAIKKQLKIKTGAAQRLGKEISLYRKEAEGLKEKLDKFSAEDVGEWDYKNTQRMMEESGKMVTDTQKRFETATGALRDLVVQARNEPALAGAEELLTAEEVLEKAGV